MNESATDVQNDTRRDRYAVPALDKAIAVLDLLGTTPVGLTVSEIAEKLGRSVGQIYRVVMSLEDIQLIGRNEHERDRYTLSLALFEWSHRHLPTERLPKLAQPVMDQLAIETKQSCQLTVWQEFSVLVIAQARSPLALQFEVRVGTRLPAQDSSAGLVILAHLPNAAFDIFLESTEPTARTTLKRRLDEIRRSGRDKMKNPVVLNITDITSPIFDHRGNVAAALTIPYLGQLYADVAIAECEARLIIAARTLSEALGGADFTPLQIL